MIRIFADANYDILTARKIAYLVSAAVIVPGILFLSVRPLNESIEFTGGTLLQIRATDPTAMQTETIRTALDAAGVGGAEIQRFGAPGDGEYVIRARLGLESATSEEATQETAAVVERALTESFGEGAFETERTEAVGPKVGGELRQKALLAILMSFGATLIYLWFRFEWRFGIAAIVATAHDTTAAVAFMSLMNLEITLVVVAAVLTIVGYSLNDTIVVFDRVRENLRKYKRKNLYEILNRSINETLPRTLLTSVTTLAATISLLVFGSEVIAGFAQMMTFGIIVGTFSSIYIASPVLLAIERRWPGEDVRGAKVIPHERVTVAG
ncbi:MAG: protein translocase subunit SecF [Gemmatimonadales bacterium]